MRYSKADYAPNFIAFNTTFQEKGAPLKTNPVRYVGERVQVTGVSDAKRMYGTVIFPDAAARFNKYTDCCIILLDSPDRGLYQNTPTDFLRRFGWHKQALDQIRATQTHYAEPFTDQRSADVWWNMVPQGLGVHFTTPGQYDSIEFHMNHVGRIVRLDEKRALVHWFNVKSSGLKDNSGQYIGAKRCYWVPLSSLALCFFNPANNEILDSFGPMGSWSRMPTFQVRDYLICRHEKPSLKRGSPGVMDGTILMVHEDQGGAGVKVQIIGNCLQEQEGSLIVLDKRYVAPFPFPFLTRGTKVVVSKDVQFRKQNLRGMVGKVKLYTDIDGDVGVEFSENISAGSLDGEGKDGYCLYIPVGSLEVEKKAESASE